ncbi:hypothetical protein AB3S75_035943 [Citrus x aurantiifolia]
MASAKCFGCQKGAMDTFLCLSSYLECKRFFLISDLLLCTTSSTGRRPYIFFRFESHVENGLSSETCSSAAKHLKLFIAHPIPAFLYYIIYYCCFMCLFGFK